MGNEALSDSGDLNTLLDQAEQARKRGDHKAQVRIYREAAKRGSLAAQFRLARLYEQGRHVKQNPALARQWFTRAAQKGHTAAEYRLARILEREGDMTNAVEWLRQAADHGHPKAQSYLAQLHDEGRGTTRDHDAARVWRVRAATTRSEQREATAECKRQDLQDRADAGSAAAQAAIARDYAKLGATRQDLARAETWFLKAVSHHPNPGYMYNELAEIFDRDDGTRDREKAIAYYEAAAQAGWPRSHRIEVLRRELTLSSLSGLERFRYRLREVDWKTRISADWSRGRMWLWLGIVSVVLLWIAHRLYWESLGVAAVAGLAILGFLVAWLLMRTSYWLGVAALGRVHLSHILITTVFASLLLGGVYAYRQRLGPPDPPTPDQRRYLLNQLSEAIGKGNIKDAIQAASESARRHRDADSYRTYAETLAAGHRFAEAVRAYGQALQQNPDDISARLGRATARWITGDKAGSIEDYRALTKIEPDNPIYEEQLRDVEGELATRSGNVR